MGIDRDRDGYKDADEVAAGSDPGNPSSTPQTVAVTPREGRTRLDRIGPNPFRDAVDVSFVLARPGRVELTAYDVLGREVRSMRAAWMEAGTHVLRWDGRSNDGRQAGAGVYYLRLETEAGRWTRPIVRVQ